MEGLRLNHRDSFIKYSIPGFSIQKNIGFDGPTKCPERNSNEFQTYLQIRPCNTMTMYLYSFCAHDNEAHTHKNITKKRNNVINKR